MQTEESALKNAKIVGGMTKPICFAISKTV